VIELEFAPGTSIDKAIDEAIANAKRAGDRVEFNYYECHFVVAEDSEHSLIWRDFIRASMGCLGENATIGPYPNELTQIEKARDRWHIAQRKLAQRRREVDAAIEEYTHAGIALMQVRFKETAK
jgi:hypothetical protein